MFIQNQKTHYYKVFTRISVCSIGIIAVAFLLSYGANIISAESTETTRELSPAQIGSKYQEIKAIAKANSKTNDLEELGILVSKADDFIASHPQYKRIDEVYYYLGNALVRLDRVDDGIEVFEILFKELPNARWIPAGLLELGLAYDKLGKHDKADEVYNKLINHEKYSKRSQAKTAKEVLELDTESRTGELSRPSGSEESQWIGKPAPEFNLIDLKGEELTVKKFHGKVVLLDFWATWCGPCKAELPNVKMTYERFKDKNFEIIGISLDRSKPALEEFIRDEALTWVHYFDQGGKIATQYGVSGIPSTFLLDGDGVIQNVNLRGASLTTAVEKLVHENLRTHPDNSTHTVDSGSQSKSIPATKLIKPKDTSPNQQVDYGSKMREWIDKPAPDIKITDLKGEELSLKDFKGQVVVLDFWATWCGPCTAEMPKVKETYEKYKDQKLQIIGISLDRSKEPLDAYIEKEELGWHQYWDESREVKELFGVRAIPSTFLIDGEGIIRKASVGVFSQTAVVKLVEENLAKTINTQDNTSETLESSEN